MRGVTPAQEQEAHDQFIAELDLAYEALFRSAKSVRLCRRCEGGWIVTPLVIGGKKQQDQATECDCLLAHHKVYRRVKAAKIAYEKRTDQRPPEADSKRLSLLEYEGDEKPWRGRDENAAPADVVEEQDEFGFETRQEVEF